MSKSVDIENVLKRDIRLSIIELWGWDIVEKKYISVPTNETIESKIKDLFNETSDLKRLVKMIKIGIMNGHDIDEQIKTIKKIINEQ